jgi:hypothetical protein
MGKRPPRYSVTYGGIDASNAQTTEQKKNLSLLEVFRHQEEVHHRLIELIEPALKSPRWGRVSRRRPASPSRRRASPTPWPWSATRRGAGTLTPARLRDLRLVAGRSSSANEA